MDTFLKKLFLFLGIGLVGHHFSWAGYPDGVPFSKLIKIIRKQKCLYELLSLRYSYLHANQTRISLLSVKHKNLNSFLEKKYSAIEQNTRKSIMSLLKNVDPLKDCINSLLYIVFFPEVLAKAEERNGLNNDIKNQGTRYELVRSQLTHIDIQNIFLETLLKKKNLNELVPAEFIRILNKSLKWAAKFCKLCEQCNCRNLRNFLKLMLAYENREAVLETILNHDESLCDYRDELWEFIDTFNQQRENFKVFVYNTYRLKNPGITKKAFRCLFRSLLTTLDLIYPNNRPNIVSMRTLKDYYKTFCRRF